MNDAPKASQPELRITMIMQVPRQEVFDAWITPENLKQWMCPEGASVSFVEFDVRIGGAFRVDMRVDGADTVHTGIYWEILPPEKLVFTWISKNTLDRASLVTVEFLARGEATTELVLTQQRLPDEEAVQNAVLAGRAC